MWRLSASASAGARNNLSGWASIFNKTALDSHSSEAHIPLPLMEAPMPLTGAIPEGRSFFCPHCGALYAVTRSRSARSDGNARCVVCQHIMDESDEANLLIYKLVHRPEDA
jgi:predicted Zn finger-like uncharacterized protein